MSDKDFAALFWTVFWIAAAIGATALFGWWVVPLIGGVIVGGLLYIIVLAVGIGAVLGVVGWLVTRVARRR